MVKPSQPFCQEEKESCINLWKIYPNFVIIPRQFFHMPELRRSSQLRSVTSTSSANGDHVQAWMGLLRLQVVHHPCP